MDGLVVAPGHQLVGDLPGLGKALVVAADDVVRIDHEYPVARRFERGAQLGDEFLQFVLDAALFARRMRRFSPSTMRTDSSSASISGCQTLALITAPSVVAEAAGALEEIAQDRGVEAMQGRLGQFYHLAEQGAVAHMLLVLAAGVDLEAVQRERGRDPSEVDEYVMANPQSGAATSAPQRPPMIASSRRAAP